DHQADALAAAGHEHNFVLNREEVLHRECPFVLSRNGSDSSKRPPNARGKILPMPGSDQDKPRVGEAKATYRPRKRRSSDLKKKFPKGSFWNPLTLDELIKQQGTKPFSAQRRAELGAHPKLADEEFEAFFRAAVGESYRPK